MTTFLLCWRKGPQSIEEVVQNKADSEWTKSIAWGELEVIKIKNSQFYYLDCSGSWRRVEKRKV
jgi:hypothetical protein